MSFENLNLHPLLLKAIVDSGYTAPTPIQKQAIPEILVGHDIIASAQTGTGKTAAFMLPALHRLAAPSKVHSRGPRILVLTPTRELALQVSEAAAKYGKYLNRVKVVSILGGMPYPLQNKLLSQSVDVLVATPGRLIDHIQRGRINFLRLEMLVLDEADRMLDMGFMDEIDAILAYVPAKRQTLLFSATYPEGIADISRRVQSEPRTVDVTDDEQPAQIMQTWCSVTRENRNEELVRTLRAWGGALNLVFCNTKIDCAEVARHIQSENIVAIALHGDLDQAQRNQVLVRFSNRSVSVLIATDVAARGLDVKDIDAVFNYELPQQPEVYVHRIGRTGRAGKTGISVSLVEEREMWRLHEIEKSLPIRSFGNAAFPMRDAGTKRSSQR